MCSSHSELSGYIIINIRDDAIGWDQDHIGMIRVREYVGAIYSDMNGWMVTSKVLVKIM